jgi:hypothetical protein
MLLPNDEDKRVLPARRAHSESQQGPITVPSTFSCLICAVIGRGAEASAPRRAGLWWVGGIDGDCCVRTRLLAPQVVWQS